MVRDRVRPSCSMTVFSNSSAALPVAAPRGIGIAGWRWSGQRRSSISSRVRNLVRRLDWVQVGYHSALFSCGVAFGLLVGGFVGFMENATPHADPPYSFAQLAATDVGWAAKLRQDWLASHPLASHPLDSAAAGQRLRETHWQRLLKSAATDSGSEVLSRVPTPATLGGHFTRLDAQAANSVPRGPNHEVESGERIAHGQ